MNVLEQLVAGPLGGWLALVVVIQLTGVVLVAAILARTVLSRSAAVRHCLWLWTLSCVLLGPAVVVLADRLGFGVAIIPWARAEAMSESDAAGPQVAWEGTRAEDFSGPTPRTSVERTLAPAREDSPASAAAQREAETPASPSVDASVGAGTQQGEHVAELEAPPQSAPRPGRGGWDALFGALVVIWVAGLTIGLARLMGGWRQLRRLSRSLRAFDAAGHDVVLDEVRQALGVVELPPVFISPDVTGPVAVGVLRSKVILPEAMVSFLTTRKLRDVLVHECAHVLRRDPLVGLLQRLAGVLYWPHPMVHYLNAQLARSREEVCDNFVLRCGDPCGYARTLLELTELCSPKEVPGMGLTGTRWTLTDRVAGLLDTRRDSMTRSKPGASWALGIALTITCGLLGVLRPEGLHAQGRDTPRAAAGSPTAEVPGRVARGVVVDEAGQPVANATVRTVQREKMIEPATTGADGSFKLEIKGFFLVRENLFASADDGRRLGLGVHLEPENAGPAKPLRIVLKPSRLTTVRVIDATDQPVADAWVTAVGFDFDGAVKTGGNGVAALRIPADSKVWCIVGLKSGAGFDYFENYHSHPVVEFEPPPAEVTLHLNGAGTVRIKAVDTSGRPIQGVVFRPASIRTPDKVSLANVSGLEFAAARSNEQGLATFDWLPPAIDDGVYFVAGPGDYSCLVLPRYESAGAAELEARVLADTKISGVVRRPDGKPAAGVLIRAEGRGATNQYCRMHTRTGSDGSYSLKVDSEQSYMVTVLDDQWAARSLTGIVVREGKARGGVNLTLGEGTLIRGRVTKGPADQPVSGVEISLTQEGDKLPKEFVSQLGSGDQESLPRWARTAADGRYQLRVGPGIYTLRGPHGAGPESLTIGAEKEVVRDLIAETPSPRKSLRGSAIEKAAAGARPIPGAIIEASPVGQNGRAIRAVADQKGDFRLDIDGDQKRVLYARDPKGTLAGFTTVAADLMLVESFAAPASRISGRVIDTDKRPVPGRRVQLRLASAPEFRDGAHFFVQTRTDAEGHYSFSAVVVGAWAEVSVMHNEDLAADGKAEVERLDVRGPDPITMADFVIPARAASVAATSPRGDGSKVNRAQTAPLSSAITSRPLAPSRGEIEALVRAIGRDPVTPELVDRAWVATRPQFAWIVDLDRIRQLLSDAELVKRLDEAARAVLGRPADTLTLLEIARRYHVGYDLETLKENLRDSHRREARAIARVRGTVVDSKEGRPIAGAIVYASDALARTDATGKFALQTSKPQREGMIWVEAAGFAMAEYEALKGAGQPSDIRVELVPEGVITGQVVGPDDRPLAGAIVRVWFKHFDFKVPRPVSPPRNDSYGFPIEVATDPAGRFAFHGLPPGLELSWYEVRQPENRTLTGDQAPLKAGGWITLKMKAGCKIGGIVIDERGDPISGALVEVRKPGELQSVLTAHTSNEGRFQFGSVAPGRWMVVIVPERHAPTIAPVIATLDRAVDNQYVIGQSAYISGKVVGEDGKPVAHATVGWVQPTDEYGNPLRSLEVARMTSTADDGTFRLGPLGPGSYALTSLIGNPRRLGRITARANQPDVVIRLEPDNLSPAGP